MSGTVKASVLMPVYNAESYLATAIESVLSQSVSEFEFVIVNDRSRDYSLRIVESYAKLDRRIRIISRENTGIVGALNDGLARCRGEFVFRMDADDIALPGRFERQLAAIRKDRDCVALGSAVLFIDPEGRPLKVYRTYADHSRIENELAVGNGGALVHPSAVFRKEALLRCGAYRESYNFIEDLDLFIRLRKVGCLSSLSDVLYSYRQHSRSVNYTKRNRWKFAAELIAPLRSEHGLVALSVNDLIQTTPRIENKSACRRKWALDAAEGGNYDSARANAVSAVRHGFFIRKNWACLRYVLSLGREQPIQLLLS